MINCPLCAAGIRDRELASGEVLQCRRCHHIVKRRANESSLQQAWAWASTGLILAVLANVQPILTFEVAGNTQSNLIITGVKGLNDQGYWPIATLVFFCAIAAPVMHFAAVSYVAAACFTRRKWPLVGKTARAIERIEPWSLVPVFAVACVVAVVKLDMLGNVTWQPGIMWVTLLSICSLAISQIFDGQLVEKRLEELK